MKNLENSTEATTIVDRMHGPLVAWIVLSLSVLFTIYASFLSYNYLEEREATKFNVNTERITKAIKERMEVYQQALKSGAAFIDSSEVVTRKEWKNFVDKLDLTTNWPGIQGLGLSIPLKAEELSSHEAAIKSEGFPDYKVFPEGKREFITAIIYLEPFDWRNKRAFGYDMWSNDMRREAMSRAIDTGRTAITGLVTLVQETEDNIQKGFLVYTPIYKKDMPLETVEQRRAAFSCWVYAAFRTNDFMKGILATINSPLDNLTSLKIYDIKGNSKDLLFESIKYEDEKETSLKENTVSFYGREWNLEFKNHNTLNSYERYIPMFIASAGVLVDIFIFYIIYILTKLRKHSTEAAAQLINMNDQLVESDKARSSNEQHIKAIVDSTVDGIVTIDNEGNIQTFNKACENLFGYSKEEVIGKNVNMLMPEPYHSEHDGYIENFLKTGDAKIIGTGREVEALRKDGTTFPIDLAIGTFNDHGKPAFTGIIRDITERKKSEQELNSLIAQLTVSNNARMLSEQRVQAIVDNTVDGIVTINDKGIVQSYNKACKRLFGYSKEEVVGKNIKMLMPEPHHTAHDGYIDNFLKTGDAKIIGIGREVEALRKDGTTFPIDLAISTFTNDSEQFFIGIMRDITERKNAQFAQDILVEKLMSSNTDLERFAYIASHDLQEPLRMVTNFTQLLASEYSEKLDENGREYIRFANDSATRMHHLVAGLLEYSRVSSGDTNLAEVDLHDILVIVEENLMQTIKETSTKISCKKLPKVFIEKVHAIQLFQNLISNSIKYRQSGVDPEINIYAEEDEDNWILKFCDNGIGIDEVNFDKIFSPFKRLHSYSEYKGTGIGLSVCKKIMNNIGGSITVHSVQGHGSNFTVIFPKKALFNSVSTGDLNERTV